MEKLQNGLIARYKDNRKIGTVIWHDEEELEIVTENLEQYIDSHEQFEIIDVQHLLAENKRLSDKDFRVTLQSTEYA